MYMYMYVCIYIYILALFFLPKIKFIKGRIWKCQWHNNQGENQGSSSGIFGFFLYTPFFPPNFSHFTPISGAGKKKCQKSNLLYITLIGFRQKKFVDCNYLHGSL